MSARLDREALLERLERADPGDETEERNQLSSISMATALLNLAEIDSEREYLLCRAVAVHLLGQAMEPEDLDFGE